MKSSDAAFLNAFFKDTIENNNLFFSQSKTLAIEKPDLKLIQDDFIYGISTPHMVTTQTLGALFGDATQERKNVINYVVQTGDTIQSVAETFNISANTIAWANDITKNAQLKTGQSLVILPVSGVTHVVKSGDTISSIAKTYRSTVDGIISFNGLTNEGDIFIGDILIVPNGIMPEKTVQSNGQTPLPDSFFIFPAEGQITQGLHYYNGVDVGNKCGTSVYAAASGVVQRAVANGKWNFGMGNFITVLHSNGVSSYYGHLMTLFVSPGTIVNVGERIGLMGRTGDATGCHVHFQVLGAANPLAKYFVGSFLKYK